MYKSLILALKPCPETQRKGVVLRFLAVPGQFGEIEIYTVPYGEACSERTWLQTITWGTLGLRDKNVLAHVLRMGQYLAKGQLPRAIEEEIAYDLLWLIYTQTGEALYAVLTPYMPETWVEAVLAERTKSTASPTTTPECPGCKLGSLHHMGGDRWCCVDCHKTFYISDTQ